MLRMHEGATPQLAKRDGFLPEYHHFFRAALDVRGTLGHEIMQSPHQRRYANKMKPPNNESAIAVRGCSGRMILLWLASSDRLFPSRCTYVHHFVHRANLIGSGDRVGRREDREAVVAKVRMRKSGSTNTIWYARRPGSPTLLQQSASIRGSLALN